MKGASRSFLFFMKIRLIRVLPYHFLENNDHNLG